MKTISGDLMIEDLKLKSKIQRQWQKRMFFHVNGIVYVFVSFELVLTYLLSNWFVWPLIF
jgi:hypothetical protein